MIDIYCERTAAGLWNEPLNAFTNLAFLVAAWLCWRLAHNTRKDHVSVYLLICLAASIGIGSGLFHTFATRWAMLCDVLPILLFQIAFIGCYFRIVQGYSYAVIAGIIIIFFFLGYLFGHFPNTLNGSLAYAPAFALLAFAGCVHYISGKRFRHGLLFSAGVFLLSLTFRSVDIAVCQLMAVGTHFLWHLLNALLIYLVVRTYIVNLPEKRSASADG